VGIDPNAPLDQVAPQVAAAVQLPATWVPGTWLLEVEREGHWHTAQATSDLLCGRPLRVTELLTGGPDIPLGPPLTVEDLPAEDRHLAPYIVRGKLARGALEQRRDCYRDPATGEVVKTAVYLEKRPCCGEKCRHCPYNYANVPKAESSDEEEGKEAPEAEAGEGRPPPTPTGDFTASIEYKGHRLQLPLKGSSPLEEVRAHVAEAFKLPKTWVGGTWVVEVEHHGEWREMTAADDLRGASGRVTELLTGGPDLPLGPPLTLEDLPVEERSLAPYIVRGKLARGALEQRRDCYQDPATGEIIKTAVYLEKRPCCGEKCRHCPYNYANVPKRGDSSDEDNSSDEANEQKGGPD